MYTIFEKFILRTPLLSSDYFINLTSKDTIAKDELICEFQKSIIKEGVFLASPVLYDEIEKFQNNLISDDKQANKISISFLKYLARFSTRATPFGLFSGCAVGHLAEANSIIINSLTHSRTTRLDMNLTGIIFQAVENISTIRLQLKYFPNTSLYLVTNQYRFVEGKLLNGRRNYQIVEIEFSEYLAKIFNICQNGLTIEAICKLIVDEEILFEDAFEFVNDLIDNQVLCSELQQSVSGSESIEYLLSQLSILECDTNLISKIKIIKNNLKLLDFNFTNSNEKYIEIIEILETLNIVLDKKYIFQTDTNIGTISNSVKKDIANEILESLTILNKITPNLPNSNIDAFKIKFLERYEEQEMPLTLILDNEIGLGYPVSNSAQDINPLIDDLHFKNSKNLKSSSTINWSKFHELLLNKMIGFNKNNLDIIELYDNDFDDFPVEWNDLPSTFSAITQIIQIDNVRKIVMDSAGGSSATNLIGRFCHGNQEIHNYAKEIIDFENSNSSHQVNAEIVHLPEDRLGNILMRPSFRNYEIPYLSRSTKETSHQLTIDDLFLSVKENRIVIRSKKLNAEILPKLSTAHNFTSTTLPVYRFLCDMQFQNKRPYLSFDWGNLLNSFSYFPRVVYKNIIFSTAKWRIQSADLKEIFTLCDIQLRLKKIKKWRTLLYIPQYIYVLEGDNKILINLSNNLSINVLQDELKNKKNVMIEEFLFSEDTFCHSEKKENFVNEVIFSFLKNSNSI